jgi:hypothetical protein
MSTSLALAENLALPLETVNQAIGILAKRRAGKSYAARRLAEQLLRRGQQVVIVDPKGDWWGIRSAADGRSPGLPVVIVGGERGDVRLEPSAGEVVAKLVVEERVSALLDLSLLRKHEVATFMTAFLENLYRLKAREVYRTPMMLVIDEADAVAPQKPQKGEERMLGAAEDIVRRGGQRGIGCTLVTQRSAVLNKNVLTQVQVLVALRTIAPQDLKAMDAWIEVHGTPEQRAQLMESLPSLPTGDAWFWSPGWPTGAGIFRRVHVLPIETFDSGATPEPGKKPVEPKNLADVDLGALERRMAETIARSKADDPRELRKRIAELERDLAKKPSPVVEKQEVPVLTEANQKLLSGVLAVAEGLADEVRKLSVELVTRGYHRDSRRDNVPPEARQRVRPAPAAPRRVEGPPSSSVGTSGLRRMLVALAQRPNGLTNRQLGVRAGVSSRSGTFSTYLSRARSANWIEGSGTLRITDEGLRALGSYDPLPEGPALADYWINSLGGGAARMLRVLVDAAPRGLTNAELGQRAEISHGSGTFSTYLSRLRSLELVEGRGELRASDELL